MRCGNGSKRFLVGLCLCLVASSGLFSQEVSEMTDAEIIAELLTNLEKREGLLNESESLLKMRDAILTERKSALEKREISLDEREKLTQEWDNLLTEIEVSLKSYADDTKRRVFWLTGGVILLSSIVILDFILGLWP